MISIHRVNEIEVKSSDLPQANWITLVFKGYPGESVEITLFIDWYDPSNSDGPNNFAIALAEALRKLPKAADFPYKEPINA